MAQLWRVLAICAVLAAVAHQVRPQDTSQTTTTANPISVIVTNTTNVIDAALQSLLKPVIGTVLNGVFANCRKLRQILKPVLGKDPPNLDKLALVFISPEITISYNLSEAAELLPTSRWFKHQKKTIIFVHGYWDSPYWASYKAIADAFLEKHEYNVVALDSSAYLGLDTLYLSAVRNVRYIGERLGDVLAKMLEVGTTPSSIYLVGHSLGAHIAGIAAKRFMGLTGRRIGRITGLDPAGTCFVNVPRSMRLATTDAYFVDLIHTNAGVFGLNEEIGHIQFYPNGGSRQPGCLTEICDHNRAWQYYADTVLHPKQSQGVACRSWGNFKKDRCDYTNVQLMGYKCPITARGRYYLQTNGVEPFGREEGGLHYDQTTIQREHLSGEINETSSSEDFSTSDSLDTVPT